MSATVNSGAQGNALGEHDAEHDTEHIIEKGTGEESTPVQVVIMDPSGCWLGDAIDFDVGLTIVGTISEDPANWEEVAWYWSRYRTAAVSAELPAGDWERSDEGAARKAIAGHGNWLLFDLRDKRLASGKAIQPIESEMTFSMCQDAQGKQCGALPIRLPPWWELFSNVDASELPSARHTPIQIPHTNREILYGRPLVEDLASRILKIAAQGALPGGSQGNAIDPTPLDSQLPEADRLEIRAWHERTVQVHREWLMTPREDLSNARPRDLLHGAHAWIDAVIDGQRLRFETDGIMIASPEQVHGFADAPLGREELIIYFDLCRDLIAEGWRWCLKHATTTPSDAPALVSHLGQFRDEWLAQPYEGGSPPSFIIECSRRRVPRAEGVPIEGMDQCESQYHVLDCNCPICNMLASGLLGVGFSCLDGHHLELDEEFAFSLHERQEDWEIEVQEWREIAEASDDWDEDAGDSETASDETLTAVDSPKPNAAPVDEFASAWSHPMSEGPLPGDPHGFLKLAFRLSEVIGDLERLGSPRSMIRKLNQTFRAVYESDESCRGSAKQALQETLEQVANHYPLLLPKLCDLQSLFDERERRTSPC